MLDWKEFCKQTKYSGARQNLIARFNKLPEFETYKKRKSTPQ
jgi:hypothetical protein